MKKQYVQKLEAVWWNFSFITSAVLLFWLIHFGVSFTLSFANQELALVENVKREDDFQRMGATRVLRSGREVVQEYTISTYAEEQKKEYQLAFMVLMAIGVVFPSLLALTFVWYQKLSLLAVDRNFCLFLISILCCFSIFYYELNRFIEHQQGMVFFIATFFSIVFIPLFSFFVGLQPKEMVSPYYRARVTELELPDQPNMAA